MANPFKGLKDRIVEIETIGGEKIRVKPLVKDAEALLTSMKAEGSFDPASVSKISETLKTIIKRANPDADDEDIDTLIAQNYGKFFMELYVLFGFTTREQIEKSIQDTLKKKLNP